MAASLTQTAIITRKIIRFAVYITVFVISARTVFLTGAKIYRHFFPVPPPDATVEFGRLPALNFPIKQGLPSLTLNLELTEGQFPLLPEQAKVYFMPKPAASLLGLEDAQAKAISFGFLPDAQQVTQAIYRFNHKSTPATLEINIVTGVFSMSYDLSKDTSLLELRPPAPEVATEAARSALSSADLLAADLSGPTSHEFLVPHEFLQTEGKPFVSALSQSESNFVRINLFRKDYDGFPSLTPNPQRANVWFIVSGSKERDKDIFAGEYHYFPVDANEFATYPLKTSEVAWEELQGGGGYIASLGTNEDGNITIRRIYLAYYDADEHTDFFQPIVVFEGDGEFSAYVPAVSSEYYGE